MTHPILRATPRALFFALSPLLRSHPTHEGVYHITRDGCRLWCSRCHPGLPPELPTDGDPEVIATDEGDGAGDGNTGLSSGTSATGNEQGPTPDSSRIGTNAAADAGETASVPLLSWPTTGSEGGSAPASNSAPPLSLPPPASASALAGALPPASTPGEPGGVAPGAGDSPRTTSTQGTAQASGATAASPDAGDAGGGDRASAGEPKAGTGAAGGRETPESEGEVVAAEGVRAPLKRDLLRRKFDEEISEPWVQCDRCNSWVHQVNGRGDGAGVLIDSLVAFSFVNIVRTLILEYTTLAYHAF